MFVQLCTLALALPLVSALNVNAVDALPDEGSYSISWTYAEGDPSTFSIELVNPSFHNTYAIASNVPTANGQVTVIIPQVNPGGDYQIEFVAINNVNDVYATSNTFSVTAVSSMSSTASSTSSTSATTVSSASTTATFSTPSAATTTTPVSSGLPTSGTSSAATTTPSNFSSGGAASLKLVGIAPVAALVFSAVAGAAMAF